MTSWSSTFKVQKRSRKKTKPIQISQNTTTQQNKDGPPHNSKKTETKGERNSDSHFGTFLLIFTSIHIHTTHTFTGFGQRGKDDDSEQNERRGHHQNRTDTGI